MTRIIPRLVWLFAGAFVWASLLSTRTEGFSPALGARPGSRVSPLGMGFWDRLTGRGEKEGDFVKLDTASGIFGPGPLVVLCNIPDGITNDEIRDMLEDGAPSASRKGVVLYRIRLAEDDDDDEKHGALGRPMGDALAEIANGSLRDGYAPLPGVAGASSVAAVALFSGFSNEEMLAAYNILGGECYQEAGVSPACAKAVPNAMGKPLRQVIEEIGGDHQEAMKMMEDQQQQQQTEDL